MKKLFIFVVIILLFGGYVIWKRNFQGPMPEITEAPTDFSASGVIVFNNPGLKPDVPYLIYEEPGAPALTKELVFDPLSACVAETGATPCVLMSVTLDIPFGGKRVIVEGVTQSDGAILVRKLRALREGEMALVAGPGRVFISWPQAVEFIETCNVEMVIQAHSLDVTLKLKDGREVVAVEPKIDEVFSITEKARACRNIIIATE